jgi:hypothetical protein
VQPHLPLLLLVLQEVLLSLHHRHDHHRQVVPQTALEVAPCCSGAAAQGCYLAPPHLPPLLLGEWLHVRHHHQRRQQQQQNQHLVLWWTVLVAW